MKVKTANHNNMICKTLGSKSHSWRMKLTAKNKFRPVKSKNNYFSQQGPQNTYKTLLIMKIYKIQGFPRRKSTRSYRVWLLSRPGCTTTSKLKKSIVIVGTARNFLITWTQINGSKILLSAILTISKAHSTRRLLITAWSIVNCILSSIRWQKRSAPNFWMILSETKRKTNWVKLLIATRMKTI